MFRPDRKKKPGKQVYSENREKCVRWQEDRYRVQGGTF